MMSTLHEVPIDGLFCWRDTIYKLVEIINEDRYLVIAIARLSNDIWQPLAHGGGCVENFNPYAKVGLGEIAWKAR
jgi:hypothetical protein